MSRKKRQARQVAYVTAAEVPAGFQQVCKISECEADHKALYGAISRGQLRALVIGVTGGGYRRGSMFVDRSEALEQLDRLGGKYPAGRSASRPEQPTKAPAQAQAVAAGQEELVAVMRELVAVAEKLLAAVKPVAAAPHARPAVRSLFGEPIEMPG